MAPFELLYRRPCQMPLIFDQLEDRVYVGRETIQEMEYQLKTIRQRIKKMRKRHNSYVDAHRVDRSYEVVD
jgi:hypothetical protein